MDHQNYKKKGNINEAYNKTKICHVIGQLLNTSVALKEPHAKNQDDK
jgi:hypothetical protein